GLSEYLLGIYLVFARIDGAAQATYFFGELYINKGASKLYFPVLLVTKMSLGALVLILSSFVYSAKRLQFKRIYISPQTTLILVFTITFLIFGLRSDLNIGL